MVINEFHRFEGDSSVDDMSVVYAVTCKDGLKGTFVSGFGANADSDKTAFLDTIPILED